MRAPQSGEISNTGRRLFAVTVVVILLAVMGIVVDIFPLQSHSKPLRVGFSELRPYISVSSDGRPTGLEIDIIKEAANRSGQELIWRAVTDGDKALRDGEIDVYPLMTVTRDRLQRYHFSEYWWQNSLQLISSRERPVNRVGEAGGKRIGVARQTVVATRSLPAGARLEVRTSSEALVTGLCRGDIDAMFVDIRSIQRYLVDRLPPCSSLQNKAISVPEATLQMGTAANFLVRNRADLLFAHINELVADGTLANVAASYAIATPSSNQRLAQMLQTRQQLR